MGKRDNANSKRDTYKELQKRLKRRLRDLKKRGFTPNRAMNEEWLSSEFPTRITQSKIEKFQEAYKNIYDYVKYYNPITEEYISGTERRKQERSIAARKGAETRRQRALERDRFWEEYDDNFGYDYSQEYLDSMPEEALQILSEIEGMVDEWSPSESWSSELTSLKMEDRETLKSVFQGARDALGDTQLVNNIKSHEYELLSLLNQILYESGSKYRLMGRDGVQFAIQRVRDIFYGQASTVRESMELSELAERINESE